MKSFLFLVLSMILGNTRAPPPTMAAKPIPGTNLLTETQYKISPRNFPKGVLTPTATKNSVDMYHYVQVDNNLNNAPDYESGGKLHNNSLWILGEFRGNIQCDDEIGYVLTNKGLPSFYGLTWSDREFVEDPGQTNYIVMAEFVFPRRPRFDFMLKPVLVNYDNADYYQLQMRGLPKGVVTYSRKTYFISSNNYIMVDDSRDSERMKNYTLGPDGQDIWYSSTLFAFDKPA